METKSEGVHRIMEEKYGSTGRRWAIVSSSRGDGHVITSQPTENRTYRISSLQDIFKSAFLPQGYPESVSEDYLEYQIWDTLQAFCSSITGTLAMQAMLKGYGVGDETATAAAATLTWIFKDGAGMLGRILFAWFQGSQLDCDAKRWRLFADVLNDFAMMLELIAPIFKPLFAFIACVAGVAKSIVGVAGGATRAALTQHQARRDNMADVSAKDGSQETLVNLLALVAGMVITPMVANNQPLVWLLFIVFTFLHLFANYKAVSAVVMETVNLPRLNILAVNYLNNGKVLTPEEVAKVDPVIKGPGYKRSIKLGCSVSKIISGADLETISKHKSRANFIAKVEEGSILIALHKYATDHDIFKAGLLAILLDAALEGKLKKPCSAVVNPSAVYSLNHLQEVIRMSRIRGSTLRKDSIVEAGHDVVENIFQQFLNALADSGWTVTRTHFGPDEWRYIWPEDSGFKKEI